jgi:hypothetical protein
MAGVYLRERAEGRKIVTQCNNTRLCNAETRNAASATSTIYNSLV